MLKRRNKRQRNDNAQTHTDTSRLPTLSQLHKTADVTFFDLFRILKQHDEYAKL